MQKPEEKKLSNDTHFGYDNDLSVEFEPHAGILKPSRLLG